MFEPPLSFARVADLLKELSFARVADLLKELFLSMETKTV